MGDAHNKKPKQDTPRTVALLVRSDAHVDVADLDEGQVTKLVPLVVSERVAERLLARHSYLTTVEGMG
jgi:hypothetical protein